jgi:hypothetical protein
MLSYTLICFVLLYYYARHSANSGSSSDAAETDTVATDSTLSLVAAAAADEGSSSSTNATSSSSSSSSSGSSLAGGAHSAHTKASSSQVQHHMAVIGEDIVRRPSSAGVTVTDFSVKAHAQVRKVLNNVLRSGPKNSLLLRCIQKYIAAVYSAGCSTNDIHCVLAVAVRCQLQRF